MTQSTYLDIIKAINPWLKYMYIGGQLRFQKAYLVKPTKYIYKIYVLLYVLFLFFWKFGTEFDKKFLAPSYLGMAPSLL